MSHSNKEGFDEKDIPAEQSQTQKDARILREDEYPERPQCLEAEANEGKEKLDRLNLAFLRGHGNSLSR